MAIAVVIVEWVCRGAITLIFRVIPMPWKEERYAFLFFSSSCLLRSTSPFHITILFPFLSPHMMLFSDTPKLGEDPNYERGTIEYIFAQGYLKHFFFLIFYYYHLSSRGTMTLDRHHAEEHFVTTPDGYVLGLHRIPATHVNDGADEVENPHIRPVLIVHGFMHCSEAFTIRQRAADSLPLVLNGAGYDIWLGSIHKKYLVLIELL